MVDEAHRNGSSALDDGDRSHAGAPMGEVVEASTTRFRAVAVETFEPPPFGAFVKVEGQGSPTYGVVAEVEHASVDPGRRAMPLGRTWDELRREQPQVLELLTTEFEAIAIAFAEDGVIRPYLPPMPPRVHDFVAVCGPREIVELTEDLSFVRSLGSSGLAVAPELVAAAIRGAAAARDDEGSFLLRAGREVADLYRADYERACSILRRLGMRVAGDGHDRTPPKAVALRGESSR